MDYIQKGLLTLREKGLLYWPPFILNIVMFSVAVLIKTPVLAKPGIHLKFSVPNGLVTMSDILQTESNRQGFHFPGEAAILLMVLGLVLSSFLEGGWLKQVFRSIENQPVSWDSFKEDAVRYFIPLLLMRVLIFGLGLVFMMPAMLHPIILLLAIPFFIYLTFFWPLAIVGEDLSVSSAFSRGYRLLGDNLKRVLLSLLPIFLLAGGASSVINLLAQNLVTYVVAVIIWSYVGSVFSIGVTYLYSDLIGDKGGMIHLPTL